MANPITRPKFKDDEVVVATTSMALEGIEQVIVKGTQLRGSHPAVKKAPQLFVPFGTPASEWPPEIDQAASDALAAERLAESERKYPTIPADEVVVCIQGFRAGFSSVDAGALRRRTDPIVQKHPQFFAEPPRPLAVP